MIGLRSRGAAPEEKGYTGMDALALLRMQSAGSERQMQQIMAQVTPDQAVWRLEGSTANSIITTFLHVYHAEDRAVHGQLGTETIFATGGWQSRLGFDPSAQWQAPAQADVEAGRAYAAAVQEATRQYLGNLGPNALEQEIDTPRGRQPLVNRLNVYLVSHKLMHAGEIAALLGCQGVKGLPF